MRHASFRAVSPTGLVVDTVITESDRIMINTHPAAQAAACPGCGIASAKVHSHYVRRLLDLPSHGRAVHLRVQVRRFRCSNRNCQRRIFGEPLPDTTALRGARRTSRLEVIVHHLGVAWGGRPGASLARRLMLPVSKDTCHKMRGRNGSFHYYYYCRNHDPLRAGGEHRRCPERNVPSRRTRRLRLRSGPRHRPCCDRTCSWPARPRYQRGGRQEATSCFANASLPASTARSTPSTLKAPPAGRSLSSELHRARRAPAPRQGTGTTTQRAFNAQRQALVLTNVRNWHSRTGCGTASKAFASVGSRPPHRSTGLRPASVTRLRLVIDEVRVSGWLVEIRFRIPLDNPPEPPNTRVSTKNRLRSLHKWLGRVIPRSHYRSLQELEMAPWHPMISDVVSAPSSGGHRGSAMCRHYASSSMTWRAIRRSAVPRPSVNRSYTLVSTCRAWSRCPLSANN